MVDFQHDAENFQELEQALSGRPYGTLKVGGADGAKYWVMKDFARNTQGRIMLTDHGSKVWFRNLVLKPLQSREIPPLKPAP